MRREVCFTPRLVGHIRKMQRSNLFANLKRKEVVVFDIASVGATEGAHESGDRRFEVAQILREDRASGPQNF